MSPSPTPGWGSPRRTCPTSSTGSTGRRSPRSRSTGGTGLGLAIAAWIAARHAGRIDVSSRPGLGSRFTLAFPLTPPEPEEEEKP